MQKIQYHHEIPGWAAEMMETQPLQRLREIGMNCGCEYTNFPRFRGIQSYSRREHSLGAGLIVWHFTGDRIQSAAALLHDIATPVFAHTVDFLNGDALTQESTEAETEAYITASEELSGVLARAGIPLAEVVDYHRYPIADNDSPRLSADRLEYTLGNALRYRIRDACSLQQMYDDILAGIAEDGQAELMFRDRSIARDFADAALRCSEIYTAVEDRFAMQSLAELLKDALTKGILTRDALWSTEPEVIQQLKQNRTLCEAWESFRNLHEIRYSGEGSGKVIHAKKRFIDPFVAGQGRLSEIDPDFSARLKQYLESSQDTPLYAV